ncbi:thioredoxin [Thiobacter aerophilum]|uniref:Thioredoxin n=1 Tax=Thiobacter aerophilum TaxID=3121275 RepID=A0ABV0EGU7_9BURK
MASHSFDVTATNFKQVVLDAPKNVPVLVDFWATWCGPCRVLKPILEKLAEEYQGRFILAKVETDANPELAAQFGIRGVPTVKAFLNGEMVDEFSGALPESQVRAFIDALIPSPGEALRQRAQEVYASGDAAQALKLLGEASKLDPHNEKIRIDTAAIMVDLGEMAEAKRLLSSLSPQTALQPRVQELLARIEFAEKAKDLPDEATLASRITANENDLEARLQLANLYIAQGRYEPALEQLLEIVRRDRHFQDDVGRKTMISVFNLLGGGELVSKYRRLLASALN